MKIDIVISIPVPTTRYRLKWVALATASSTPHRPMSHHLAFLLAASTLLSVIGCSRHNASDAPDTVSLSQPRAYHTLPSGFYKENTVLRHRFHIVNDTPSVVRLTTLSTSCSCTTADLTRKELRPNEETFLDMSLKLVSTSGKRDAQCVLTDDKQNHWVFGFGTTSYPLMEFAQGGNHIYLHLGVLTPGNNGTGTADVFTYAAPGRQPPTIKITGLSNTPLTACLQGVGIEELPDGFRRRRERVVVRSAPQTEPGLHSAQARIACQSTEPSGTLALTALWQIKSLYVVAPDRIALGILGDKDVRRIRRTVAVQRVDGQSLRIVAVHSTHPGIAVEGQARLALSKEQFTVVVNSALFANPAYGEVIVETDHPAQSKLVIPVVAFR